MEDKAESMMSDIEWEKRDIFGYRPRKQWGKPGLLIFNLLLPLVLTFTLQIMASSIASAIFVVTNPDMMSLVLHAANTENMTSSMASYTQALYNSPVFYVCMTVFYALSIVVYLLIIRFGEKEKAGSIGLSFGTSKEKVKALFNYLRGLAIGLLMMLAIFLLLVVTGQVKVTGFGFAPSAIPLFIANLLMWIPQGASEEVMTRGYMMSRLSPKFGRVAAITISTIFFSLMHMGNNGINPIAVINLALTALFFALLAYRTKDLWTACAIHTIWNLAQGNLFGFEVSGTLPAASVISTKPTENSIAALTGGAFGPEGGLFVTLVVAASLVVLLLVTRKRREADGQS